MKRLAKAILLLASVLAAPGVATSADPAQLQRGEGFQYPLEIYPNGKTKTQLTAAELTNTGPKDALLAKKVRVEFFDQEGNRKGVLHAADCVWDKDKGVARSKSAIRLKRDGVVISGTGFEWFIRDQKVRILKNAKVKILRSLRKSRKLKKTASPPKTKAKTP